MATRHAAAATAIRRDLKAAFPSIKFRVRSRSFSGGNAVDAEWTDGPTFSQVEAIIGPYQYGHFDGMIDLYEYSNRRDDIPQAKYVHPRRDISPEARRAAVAEVNHRFGWSLRSVTKQHGSHIWEELDHASDVHTGSGWQSDWVNRTLSESSMLCPDCGAATLPGDAFCPECGTDIGTERAMAAD